MLPSIFSENLFDDFFNSAMFPNAEHELYGKHAKNLMNTDVREVENGYEIDMNLPGFKKDEVEIQLQDGWISTSSLSSPLAALTVRQPSCSWISTSSFLKPGRFMSIS